jgi:hypothetical protein
MSKPTAADTARVAAELDARQRVLTSKARLAAYGHQRTPRKIYDGQPHPEREQKAGEGVEMIPLIAPVPGAPTPTRGRVRAPMTLRSETAEALAAQLRDMMVFGDGASKKELAIRENGTLDKVLGDVEKDALDRFTRDVMLIKQHEIRISSYGERSYPLARRDEISRAYQRMDFVRDWMPVRHWEELIRFGKHMLCLHEDGLPTTNEIGMNYGGSKDSRVASGAYRGRMCTIAEGLNEVYTYYQQVQVQLRRERMLLVQKHDEEALAR